jgi:hypothetical protein
MVGWLSIPNLFPNGWTPSNQKDFLMSFIKESNHNSLASVEATSKKINKKIYCASMQQYSITTRWLLSVSVQQQG